LFFLLVNFPLTHHFSDIQNKKHLPSKCETLRSIPSTDRERERERERQRERERERQREREREKERTKGGRMGGREGNRRKEGGSENLSLSLL
jgi:hypothetical protein